MPKLYRFEGIFVDNDNWSNSKQLVDFQQLFNG